MARVQQRQHAAPSSPAVPKPRRQRASPSRLTKLYKELTEDQRKRIRAVGFGGLLKIASPTLPAGFADWLVAECYDAESSELVLLGRGRVSVNAESVHHALGLPSKGDEVKYDLDVSAINFINTEYCINEGTAPSIDCILERLKKNKMGNDDFLRSWLMIAISTFLCPPTGLCISPRCYPPLLELSKIKKLNWSQFVVDQLKVAASNMGKRRSFKGCLLVVVLAYVDSLEVANVQIPSTRPRVVAWSRKLLDQVIKLVTKHDGSFGKLKLKESNYSTPQHSLFHVDEITKFVSSKVPHGISDQRKSMLNNAVTQFCSGFIVLLGSFLENISEGEASASQPMGTSKRTRANGSEGEPSSHQKKKTTKCSKLDQDAPSCSRRQTRGMSTEGHVPMFESLPDESEEELLSDSDEDEEDEDLENDIGSEHEIAIDDDVNANLDGNAEHDVNGEHDGNGDDDGNANLPPIVEEEGTCIEKEDEDSQDLVPLKVRLEASNKAKKDTTASIEPQPLEVIPPQSSSNPKSSAQGRKEKLRLPRHDSLDFTPPEIDIMKFIEPEGGPSNAADLSEGDYARLEHDALMNYEKKKAAVALAVEDVPPSSSSKKPASGNDLVIELDNAVTPPFDNDTVIELGKETVTTTSKEPGTANSSVTPAFVPHARRIQKRAAVIKSPYIDFRKKKTFRCSKEVSNVYASVCAHGKTRSTRSTQDEDVCLISYWSFYVTRDHLALSVKPGGKLMSTTAEIGIYAIDQRGKKVVKRVLPLRVTTLIQQGNLTSNQIKYEFYKPDHHLHHHQMVMFPVLQMLGDSAPQVGHYFLLVLNLRNGRFEVLDSMRSLQDEALSKCCNILMVAIKELWAKHGYEEKKPIGNFEIVDICVPIQSNNHDCGFHMLMHVEHWDGRSMQYFKESDIPNIRKLLLYKWLTHKDNWVNWRDLI